VKLLSPSPFTSEAQIGGTLSAICDIVVASWLPRVWVEARDPQRRDAKSCAIVRKARAVAFGDARTYVFVRSVMPYPCAATTIATMVVSISLFDGRVPRNLEWTDQARGPASPRSPSRNGYASFFPLPRRGGIPREAKKPSTAVLRCAAGLTAAGRSLPGPRTAIEAAMVAARQQTETTMATIGTFTAADNGYTGSVKTLTLNVKAKFVATDKDNDKAPDYRIIAGATEFGAAWKKTAQNSEREYLSVKLDDPTFPAPIYASLVRGEGDDSFVLIWSRRNAD
jgi:uncharacterized protein (DUF736 family)